MIVVPRLQFDVMHVLVYSIEDPESLDVSSPTAQLCINVVIDISGRPCG